MTKIYSPKYVAFSLAAFYGASAAVDTGTVSITAIPEWAVQASCVQNCLYQGTVGFGYNLATNLGCVVSTSTVFNGCYCTNVVSSKASVFLKQCVSIFCAGTAQVDGAISVYDNYCTAAGYPRSVAAASTTTVAPGKSATTTQAGGAVYTYAAGDFTTTYTIQTSFPTSTAGSSTGTTTTTTTTTKKKKVNIGAIVGGVVAGLVVLGALFIAFFMWMRKRNQKARANQLAARQQQQMMQQQQMPFIPQQQPPPGGPPQYMPTPVYQQQAQNPIPYGNPSPVSPISSFAVPASTPTPVPAVPPVVKKPVAAAGGRAELGDPNATTLTPNVEVEANEQYIREVEANEAHTAGVAAGNYGLRAGEVDGSGRNVGELHGDGRQGAGHAELPGASHPWN